MTDVHYAMYAGEVEGARLPHGRIGFSRISVCARD
jgi:hypothetical protein